MQGMHVIFNGINVNGRPISKIEYCDVPKKIELTFEIGLPVNETIFNNNNNKKDTFSHKLMLIISKY